jgi:3-oxoacyl-[acyl-carrier protein] reductase
MTARFDDFAVGDRASLEHELRAEDVRRFVDLTGDDNPVHVDDAYATAHGLRAPVAHGMLTAAYVSTVIGTKLPGPGALWMSERFRFRAPVYVGDTIRVEVVVKRKSPSTRVMVLDVTIHNHRGALVLDGEAHVQLLEDPMTTGEAAQATGTAVVTGAAKGIGSAIARRLAQDGWSVVVNFRSDAEGAEATVAAIAEAGGTASAFRADLADAGAVAELFDYAADTYGPVLGLVNNAGGAPRPQPLLETTWADLERHLGDHLRIAALCVERVLPGMVERGDGRIVNVTSQAGYGPPPQQQAGYAVAKAALAAYTRAIAVEAGPHGVRANAIAPGLIPTDMTADLSARQKAIVASQAPLRRLAGVDDVADATAFLLGPQAAYMTGQTVHLSGGQVMG